MIVDNLRKGEKPPAKNGRQVSGERRTHFSGNLPAFFWFYICFLWENQ